MTKRVTTEPTSREITLAWLLDRRDQHDPSTARFSAIDDLIGRFAEGEDVEAYARAELDDLVKQASTILSLRHRILAGTNCTRPPPGWQCSRERDHDGPCAAWAIKCPTRCRGKTSGGKPCVKPRGHTGAHGATNRTAAEIGTLDRIIARLPEDDVITRPGIVARRDALLAGRAQ